MNGYIFKGGSSVKFFDTFPREATVKLFDTFTREVTLSNCFCLPSETRSALKGKKGPFFPLRVDPLWKGLGVKESKQKFPKVVSRVKMAEYLPDVSSRLNYYYKAYQQKIYFNIHQTSWNGIRTSV